MDRRLALLLPSLTLLLLTALGWTLWPPPKTEPRLAWPWLIVIGVATGATLLAGATLLERTVPSFRRTSRRLERLVRDLRLPRGGALLAALVSGVSEELFFRGWLLPSAGLWWQALVFMLLHPAGRAGWSYTLYTGVAGLAFGAVTVATGSLWPALIAHVGVNLHGFSSVAPDGGGTDPRAPGRFARSRVRAPASGAGDGPGEEASLSPGERESAPPPGAAPPDP